ncbi:MAG: hypothetical protein EA356_03520 [Geminicoccaceae bacterium]|nr:MAG: hypothetical protein EA356_03520 [Geminicoccaceae bacterium]
MFGFSLTKILVTILIVVAVWRVFGMVERYRAMAKTADAPKPQLKAMDFHECPRCGDYVAKGVGCPKCKGSA